MFLRPFLGVCKPKLFSSIKHTRSLRPSIKIGAERFQLSLDVHQYNKDELRVKAHPDYVVIEGKQEKDTQQGYVLRQFIRKFKLPAGCIPSKIESRLSSDGMLTIVAPRSFRDANTPMETVAVPISYGPSEKKVPKLDKMLEEAKENLKPKVYANPCADFPKVKPK